MTLGLTTAGESHGPALVAIVTGLPAWTALFLLTTVMTSVTGFMFPFSGVTPGIVVGASQRSSGISARPTRVGDHRRAAAGDSLGMKTRIGAAVDGTVQPIEHPHDRSSLPFRHQQSLTARARRKAAQLAPSWPNPCDARALRVQWNTHRSHR